MAVLDDSQLLADIAAMVRPALTREYPNHLMLQLAADGDLGTPRTLHPVFYGSFDWHSAVHGHWCLVRILRVAPSIEGAAALRELLRSHFTADALARERHYLSAPGREGFERPYGLAWLLQLAAELREWGDGEAAEWAERLRALEQLAADRLLAYARKLPLPVRTGEHSQTAFALGLALDWAVAGGEAAYHAALSRECIRLYGADRAAPVAYEPGGTDFLSPALAEADLMRRALESDTYAPWLSAFLPQPDASIWGIWLEPVEPADRSDGKFAHWDGLNLSRSWMLDGILSRLPASHALRQPLETAASRHRAAGLAHAVTEDYMGSHWLGSFAVYLLTRRGITS